MVGDWAIALPSKPEIYATIERTIAHFKLATEGLRVPAGEAHAYTEAANGGSASMPSPKEAGGRQANSATSLGPAT